MDLYLIRHGESEANRDGVIQGRLDSDLTARGLEQARAAGRFLKERGLGVDAVVTSPLLRTRRTAEAIAGVLGLAPVPAHDFLVEIDVGRAEGLTRADLEAREPAFLADLFTMRRGWELFGGETHADFFGRVAAGLDALLPSLPDRVAIVTHGGPLKAIVRHLLRFPDDYVLDMRNCTIVHVGLLSHRGRRMATLGFHVHLDLLGLGEGTGLRSV
jgi:broad specificity phosphatase PhoE